MTRRIPTFALLFVLAGLCLPQNSTTYVTSEVRRVGDRLACKCGSCNNTVATCQMLQCHYSSPAREKIATLQKQGLSDQAVVDAFVKDVGLAALAAPPTEGFNLLGWVMPFAALSLGMAGVLLYLRRLRTKAVAATETVAAPPTVDEKYRRRVEAEMAEMD